VETGNLPVIGLRDIMCHVAAVLERKAAGEVKRGYVITSTICVNRPVVYSVQCNQTLSTEQYRLVATQCSCILLNFFHSWTAVECGQPAESQDAWPQKHNQAVVVKLRGWLMQSLRRRSA